MVNKQCESGTRQDNADSDSLGKETILAPTERQPKNCKMIKLGLEGLQCREAALQSSSRCVLGQPTPLSLAHGRAAQLRPPSNVKATFTKLHHPPKDSSLTPRQPHTSSPNRHNAVASASRSNTAAIYSNCSQEIHR